MLKREWGVGSKENLPHLFIPSETAILVPEFAVEDLPLDRTAALVPEFSVTWDEEDDHDGDDNDISIMSRRRPKKNT